MKDRITDRQIKSDQTTTRSADSPVTDHGSPPAKPGTQRVRLLKPFPGRGWPVGHKLNATRQELADAGLQPNVDYLPLGTHPTPMASDLSPGSDPGSDPGRGE